MKESWKFKYFFIPFLLATRTVFYILVLFIVPSYNECAHENAKFWKIGVFEEFPI